MTLLSDVVNRDLLNEMIEQGYVRAQTHPTLPLLVYNYTAGAQYDRVWNEATRTCRGLIVEAGTEKIVARSFPKFHNYAEHDVGTLSMDDPVEVTDKLDGSLGILYHYGSVSAIATRGSFTSEQAGWANEILKRYMEWVDLFYTHRPELTLLFEIVHPENRIVVDYGDQEDLVLLGGVETETGKVVSPRVILWPGPYTKIFPAATLADALMLEPRENSEGVVVRYLDEDLMVKIKQEDYVALHRVMTGLNARNVWEIVAVRACAPFIEKSKHWGSYLGIGPERAEECLAIADDWLEGVPDEFHDWVREIENEVTANQAMMFVDAFELATRVASEAESHREQYELVKDSPLVGELLDLIRKGLQTPLHLRCWREVCPEPTAPFSERSEDVA